jgi:CRP-like cAMP-binding protein
LGEGDVAGEGGLLEGGIRKATVTVASADAEALFMSADAFQTLLKTVPAFAWGVWESVSRRMSVDRRESPPAPSPPVERRTPGGKRPPADPGLTRW